jgi:hypothetical protein
VADRWRLPDAAGHLDGGDPGGRRPTPAAERDYCTFLVFDVSCGDGPVVMRITAAPESDIDVASELDRLVSLLTATTK